MGKQNWTEVEFADCVAMATNPVNANKKFAKRIKNMHSHIKPGALVVRKGYGLKYAAPSNDRITNGSFPNFDMFWDRQAVEAGQEITCQAQKGTVIALAGSSVTDTQNMLNFWCRPYWNGSSWVDEWQWINETIITKITTATDATYKSMIEIWGATNQGIAEDSLIGWTIYNKTKNQFAKIITNKVVDGDHTRINHTLFNSDWAINDVLILSRSWLDLAYHEELYTLRREDYAYHRILHDLRIGFGGQENRPGLAVGYRKKYFNLLEIDFTDLHADIDAAALEAFSKTDEVILSTHAIYDFESYGIELTKTAGTLPTGNYYFRLIGVLDGYAEQLIAERSIDVNGTEDILLRTYVELGTDNKRLTKLTLYKSTDNITFWRILDYTLTSANWEGTKTLTLEETGRLFTEQVNYGGAGEYHHDTNAIAILTESDSVGQWINIGDPTTFLESVNQIIFTAYHGTIIPDDGSFCFNWYNTTNFSIMRLQSPLITSSKKRLRIRFSGIALYFTQTRVRVTSTGIGFPPPFGEELDYIDLDFDSVAEWKNFDFELDVSGSLLFYATIDNGSNPSDQVIGLDKLTITNISVTETFPDDVEMKSHIGYTPTFSVVKGWDQALNYRGRTYYLNPFVDKRYNNFLLVSAIHSNNSFMYDIASFSNFRELATADSNKAIGMVKLNNGAFLILKDLSLMIIDPDTGVEVETIYGVSCISRNSIDNANGIIRFCGEEEIYYFDTSRGAIPTLKNTIRDLYLAIPNKDKIFGIRDKFNNYRIRIDNTITKTEYLFTEDGPIEEEKELFAEIYRIDARGDLNFLNSGNIYLVDPDIVAYLLDDSGNWLLDDSGQTIV